MVVMSDHGSPGEVGMKVISAMSVGVILSMIGMIVTQLDNSCGLSRRSDAALFVHIREAGTV